MTKFPQNNRVLMGSKIPPLVVAHPPESYSDRALVRFRAMVQDTSYSAEMYLAKYNDGSLGGWGIESYSANHHSDQTAIDYEDLRECTVLWAVNVPGESSWYRAELDGTEFGTLFITCL